MKENCRSFTVELHDYTNEELVEFFQSTQKEEYLKELMVKNRGIIHIIATTYSIPAYDIEDPKYCLIYLEEAGKEKPQSCKHRKTFKGDVMGGK